MYALIATLAGMMALALVGVILLGIGLLIAHRTLGESCG